MLALEANESIRFLLREAERVSAIGRAPARCAHEPDGVRVEVVHERVNNTLTDLLVSHAVDGAGSKRGLTVVSLTTTRVDPPWEAHVA